MFRKLAYGKLSCGILSDSLAALAFIKETKNSNIKLRQCKSRLIFKVRGYRELFLSYLRFRSLSNHYYIYKWRVFIWSIHPSLEGLCWSLSWWCSSTNRSREWLSGEVSMLFRHTNRRHSRRQKDLHLEETPLIFADWLHSWLPSYSRLHRSWSNYLVFIVPYVFPFFSSLYL